jgi:hypothetical protein
MKNHIDIFDLAVDHVLREIGVMKSITMGQFFQGRMPISIPDMYSIRLRLQEKFHEKSY